MKIAIIGTGNMGAWLACELAAENSVAVYDINKAKAEKCASGTDGIALLNTLNDIADFDPALAINAVSLRDTIPAFGEISKYTGKDCVLCDIASVKTGIPEYYSQCGFRFVSVHPMFGPTFTDMQALKQENSVIISESDMVNAEFFRGFFQKLGLRVFEYSFAEHDEMMAYSLTIPFVSSMVFSACVDLTVVPGTTFSRHIQIARGLLSESDHLLAEILFNPHSLGKIEKITSRLEYLKHIINGRDFDEMKKFFNNLRGNISQEHEHA